MNEEKESTPRPSVLSHEKHRFADSPRQFQVHGLLECTCYFEVTCLCLWIYNLRLKQNQSKFEFYPHTSYTTPIYSVPTLGRLAVTGMFL